MALFLEHGVIVITCRFMYIMAIAVLRRCHNNIESNSKCDSDLSLLDPIYPLYY